jgi:molybdopterin-guanine dinucleotide biosynthesis protein A
MAVRGAVLAGGASSRFGGRPKGLERVGGERILDRVVRVVTAAVGEAPLLIANAPDADRWRPDLRVLADAVAQGGSLGGIYTAVTAGDGPVLVTGWDMPFLPESLLAALLAGSATYDAFLPESGGRRGLEPLCAVYGPACGPAIRSRLASGDLRAIAFHEDVRLGTLPRDQVERHGRSETMFFNVNTADDLRKAEELWDRRG